MVPIRTTPTTTATPPWGRAEPGRARLVREEVPAALGSNWSDENGNRLGVWVRYRDGHKSESWTYAGGKPQGLYAVWHYPINGVKKDTLQRTWHPNGQLESEVLTDSTGTFKEGALTRWFPNGKKRSITLYQGNQEEGIATTWHDNGRKASEGAYLRGSKTGTWRWWTPRGKVERVEHLPAREGARGDARIQPVFPGTLTPGGLPPL